MAHIHKVDDVDRSFSELTLVVVAQEQALERGRLSQETHEYLKTSVKFQTYKFVILRTFHIEP